MIVFLTVSHGKVVSSLKMVGATITVVEYLFPLLFCKINTGRYPPCSLPITGDKSAYHDIIALIGEDFMNIRSIKNRALEVLDTNKQSIL